MLSAIILPALVGHQGAVQLLFKPPVGATYRYKMNMDMTMRLSGGSAAAQGKTVPPITMNMSSSVNMKVLKRSGDVTTMETQVGAPKVGGSMAQFMGNLTKNQKGQTMTTLMDSHFHMKSAEGAASPLASALGNASFPSHPLHVGDTWTAPVDIGKVMGALGSGMAAGGGKLTMRYTVAAIRHEASGTIVVLRTSLNASPEITNQGVKITMHMQGGGTCSIEASSGVFTGYQMKITGKASAQAMGFDMTLLQSMTRA